MVRVLAERDRSLGHELRHSGSQGFPVNEPLSFSLLRFTCVFCPFSTLCKPRAGLDGSTYPPILFVDDPSNPQPVASTELPLQATGPILRKWTDKN